jgi:hypothetical protein
MSQRRAKRPVVDVGHESARSRGETRFAGCWEDLARGWREEMEKWAASRRDRRHLRPDDSPEQKRSD